QYAVGERVDLWVNKIGPYGNPQETYPFYRLPFCKPQLNVGTRKKNAGIGEILAGNELRNSGYSIHFTVPARRGGQLLVQHVSRRSSHLRQGGPGQSVVQQPMQGRGSVHRDRLELNVVHWTPTLKSFNDRFDRYLDYSFFEHQIHWFSIFNSFMMVIFLCGLVALILVRTLRNDFAKASRPCRQYCGSLPYLSGLIGQSCGGYTKDEDDFEGVDRSIGEDSGWKQV
ncbi:unnamed protein product, partial [Phaeothamnion confervicola]